MWVKQKFTVLNIINYVVPPRLKSACEVAMKGMINSFQLQRNLEEFLYVLYLVLFFPVSFFSMQSCLCLWYLMEIMKRYQPIMKISYLLQSLLFFTQTSDNFLTKNRNGDGTTTESDLPWILPCLDKHLSQTFIALLWFMRRWTTWIVL